MKMRNKVLAGLMVLVLLLASCVTGWAAENDNVTIEPLVLNALDKSASDWYSNEENRALLATCFVCDIVLSDYQNLEDIVTESLLNGVTYVGKDGLTLHIVSFSEKGTVLGLYKPTSKNLTVGSVDGCSNAVAKDAMDNLKSDGIITSYYKVSNSDIIEIMGLIVDALGS